MKTVRFNREEESMLRKVLSYYKGDFSGCVKELIAEKLEDLQDIRHIQRLKEGRKKDYFDARKIDSMFK